MEMLSKTRKRVARSEFTKNFGHNWSQEADEFVFQTALSIVENSPFLKAKDLRKTVKKIMKAYNPKLHKKGLIPMRYITGRINWYYDKHGIIVTNKTELLDNRMVKRSSNGQSYDGEKFSSIERINGGKKK